jgi:hypothetical protein
VDWGEGGASGGILGVVGGEGCWGWRREDTGVYDEGRDHYGLYVYCRARRDEEWEDKRVL